MLFNSYEFLLFLPCALMLYRLCARWLAVQNVWLVVASYVFYAWWDVRFLALIAGLTAVGYLGGLALGRTAGRPRRARAVCVATAAVCLGVLGLFKYYGFFAENLAALLGSLGLAADFPTLRLVLPVGISFYTFQILSYVADVYRRKLPPCRDAVAFAAFVSFFPQLVAGPIEKASHLLPQMQRPRRVDYADCVDGLRQALWGFVKNLLLADRVAPVVQAVYGNPASDGTDLAMATVLFALQIYGDFSGYSDIAVGTARPFGIRRSRTLATPYFARSCSGSASTSTSPWAARAAAGCARRATPSSCLPSAACGTARPGPSWPGACSMPAASCPTFSPARPNRSPLCSLRGTAGQSVPADCCRLR